MSVQAVKDVFDYAPEDLTSSELVVLLAIAEDVRQDGITRHHGGSEAIAHRTRLAPKTVRTITSRLVARGLIIPQRRARVGVAQDWRIADLHPGTRRAVITSSNASPEPRSATITPITTTRRRAQ